MNQNMKTLYIVGNGFDLHHGIPSSYREFGEYLSEHDHDIYNNAVEYLHADDNDFWSTFEENLAHLDSDSLLETASQFLVGYGAEDWSDAYHHDYQYEIEQVVSSLSSELLNRFTEWVRQLPIPTPAEYTGRLLKIDKDALFLTFNYTPTLTNLYGISERNIVHIHGKATDEKLVLGHGWEEDERRKCEQGYDPEDVDTRIQQGDEILKRYFTRTFKPTEKIIAGNQSSFDALADLEQIIVLGHSIGDVDLPYFLEVIKRIDLDKVAWKVSYHHDVEPVRNQVENLGIEDSLVEYIQLEKLSAD